MKQPAWILLVAWLFGLAGCNLLPLSGATPAPNTLTYSAPITFTIKNGSLLPGTSIAYQGKTETGSAKVMLAGVLAPKQIADSVDWSGSIGSNTRIKLNMRVATYDEQSLTLAGTAQIEILNVDVKPGGTLANPLIEFTVPVVTYRLPKGQSIPGTNIAYAGSTPDGAEFSGVDGYPFRKQFDSLQYIGRIAPKVYLRLDLRVLAYSDTNTTLAGPAQIRIESP